MNKLTWEQLDACKSPDDIRDLLMANGIKGFRKDNSSCPIALATGWLISNDCACANVLNWYDQKVKLLTPAERRFVCLFDDGAYPELVGDSVV